MSLGSANAEGRVEVLYTYESTSARGHSVNVRPGERYSLVSDTNENWWYVAKETDIDDGFYLPRSYVRSLSEDPNESFPNFRPRLLDPKETLESGVPDGQRKSQIFSSDGYKLLTSSDVDGSLKRNSRVPGFKLADPKRISKSIPVDLNFVHNIPDLAAQQRLADADSVEDSTLEIVTALPRTLGLNQDSNRTGEGSSHPPRSQLTEPGGGTRKDGHRMETVLPAENCYENLEETRRRGRPPVPAPDESPTRIVQGDWEEYREPSGRTYFYHPTTGVSTWKPPRSLVMPARLSVSKLSSGDELDSSFSADDFDRSQDEMNHSNQYHSLEGAVEEKEEEEDIPSERAPPPPSSTHFFPKEEWVSDSQPSTSLTTSSDSAGSGGRGLGHYLTNKSYGLRRGSEDAYTYSEDCASVAEHRRRDSSENQGEDLGALMEHAESRNQASLQSFHQKSVKYGLIHKCRYIEGGRRCKKQWVSLFAYLTSAHIIFYRDEKSSQKKGNHYAAPMGVCDLRGAKISWMEGTITKRKHVFQLELIDGTVDLFNTDDSQEINSWYHAVRQSIVKLPQPDLYPAPSSPKDNVRHSRTPSTHSHSPALPSPPKSHREPPAGPKTPKKDKRKSPGPVSQAVGPSVDVPTESRASILEKLKRFFRTRPSIDSLKEKGIYQPEPVFGSSLLEICKREKQMVPKFLFVCTQMIEEKGITVDGLYRISGNLSLVQKIRCQVDQERYNLLVSEDDVHVLTGALKLFFRELQEPLFPLNMTRDFLAAIKLQNMKQRRAAFKDLLSKMPRCHYDTLLILLQHLLKVAEHSGENRMQIHNLAIVFGPTLFSTGGGPTPSSQGGKKHKAPPSPLPVQSNSHLAFSMIMQGQILEYLLKEYSRFF